VHGNVNELESNLRTRRRGDPIQTLRRRSTRRAHRATPEICAAILRDPAELPVREPADGLDVAT